MATRPSRQNVDEAIVVRWRNGIAIVELVSTARRKHRRRTLPVEATSAAPCTAPADSTPNDQEAER
jgi:hypothetical protein